MPGSSPSSSQSLDMPRRPSLLRCIRHMGPRRIFGDLGNSSALNWFFLVGTLGPVFVWLLHKAFPKQKWIRLINLPVLLGATGAMPPATTLNFNGCILVGTVFNFFDTERVGGRGTIIFCRRLWTLGWLSWECPCISQRALPTGDKTISWWGPKGSTVPWLLVPQPKAFSWMGVLYIETT